MGVATGCEMQQVCPVKGDEAALLHVRPLVAAPA